MRYRRFGRTGWKVSEIGYGMWGMGGWSGSDDDESLSSLQFAVEMGCNFFDTAFSYGDGHSERLLGRLIKANPDMPLITATKIPPKNRIWPASPDSRLDECFPPDHIEEYIHISLKNMEASSIDLIQFHTWQDAWMADDRWLKRLDELKSQKLIKAIGISINRWQPSNGVKAVESEVIDAVQVIYNLFDQNPEDELFPACKKHDIAIIARVPFDEGSLTDTLTLDSKWEEGDWRNVYFSPDKLPPTLERVKQVRKDLPQGMTMPEMALRFILSNPDVSTVIPGMRKKRHVEANITCSKTGSLPDDLLYTLKRHRWERTRF
ncbi:MAG: aldo/keto reductase [Leptolinea sp.]|nr:aldo/keto reductase [Leptolinea sp.]